MSNSNNFANMPFGNLSKHFAVPKEKMASVKPSLNKPKEDIGPDDDNMLFLQAVENVIAEKPNSKKHISRNAETTQSLKNHPRLVNGPKPAETKKLSDRHDFDELSLIQSQPERENMMRDDDDIFLASVSDVRPLNVCGREVPLKPANVAKTRFVEEDSIFAAGKFEFSLLFSEEYFEGHVKGLAPVVFDKLRAGTFSPEAHIDFHGLNAVQAFETLRGFVKNAWYKGLRTVLVIHGRGRNSPNGVGVLREKLQIWLTQEPFKRVVLAFCTAQPHDGGPGSIYLLLRKRKKKGKIFWEKTPLDSDLYDV